MSVVYMEGWDYLPVGIGIQGGVGNPGNMARYLYADGWYGINEGYGGLYTTTGRFGQGTALVITDPPASGGGIKALDVRLTNGYIFGYAFRSFGANSCNFWLYDGQTNSRPFHLVFDQTGILQFEMAGQTYRTRTGAVRLQAWNYLQVKHTSAEIRIYINGNLQVLVNSPPAPQPFDAFQWSNGYSNGQLAIDDMYILDPTTGDNTTFLGNIVVRSQLSVSNGDNIQFAPHGRASNWQNVNDYQMLDANYNDDATVGQYDLYNMNPNVAARDIFAVQVKSAFAQDNGIQLYGANRIKVNGTEYTGPQKGVPQVPGFETNSSYYDVSPDSGVAWTTLELNNLQAGPVLAASD